MTDKLYCGVVVHKATKTHMHQQQTCYPFSKHSCFHSCDVYCLTLFALLVSNTIIIFTEAFRWHKFIRSISQNSLQCAGLGQHKKLTSISLKSSLWVTFSLWRRPMSHKFLTFDFEKNLERCRVKKLKQLGQMYWMSKNKFETFARIK